MVIKVIKNKRQLNLQIKDLGFVLFYVRNNCELCICKLYPCMHKDNFFLLDLKAFSD